MIAIPVLMKLNSRILTLNSRIKSVWLCESLEMSTLFTSCIGLLAILSLCPGSEGYFHHTQSECRYNSMDLKGIEFISRYVFNKLEYLRYNSTLNKFIGYTELGVKNAGRLNRDGEAEQQHTNLDGYCKPNAEVYFQTILGQTVKPTIKVISSKPSSERHTTMLVCSARNFYPEGIKVKWLRDGEEVKTDVTSTEELYNGDWYYQIHSYLELTPKSGETIACQVEHSSSALPTVVKWEPSVSEGKRNKVIIGASGIVLGLIILVAGVVYYKKKSTGRILVPSS